MTSASDGDKSVGYKLVPWLNWEEWDFVRNSLFSSCPHSIASALNRITAWRSRGSLPDIIDVTASIVEIQQKDPFFRDEISDGDAHSEEMRAMLYCMVIMRLVNGVVEKTRKKTEVSIAEAADALGLPRMLIDIRHEGSHRDLPSLQLLRLASIKALDWLKSNYWEPQRNMIQCKGDRIFNLKREIKSAIHQLAFYLEAKKSAKSSSSSIKKKGSKIQVKKFLKKFICLYSSFPLEVVTMLLKFLVKALDYSFMIEQPPNDSQDTDNADHLYRSLDDLKPVIKKLSNEEPELLLTLLKEVLNMIETQDAQKFEIGEQFASKGVGEQHKVEHLSYLFEWLVRILYRQKRVHLKTSSAKNPVGPSTGHTFPKETIVQFLRKCLMVSCPGNNQLMGAAVILAQATGSDSMIEKLSKLCSLRQPESSFNEETSFVNSSSFFSREEDSIRRAANKLDSIKLHRVKDSDASKTIADDDTKSKAKWVVAKSWKRCPIGMLPSVLGYSGHLPVLGRNDDHKAGSNDQLLDKGSDDDGKGRSSCGGGKRGAEYAIEHLRDIYTKRARENEEGAESVDEEDTCFEGIRGRLMIGGAWKRVSEEEVLAIASAIRSFA